MAIINYDINGANFAANPAWNAAGSTEVRIGAANFAPGTTNGLVAGPNARDVSNTVVAGNGDLPAPPYSGMMYAWGQFIDHDLDLTPGGGAPINITIPVGDQTFVPGSSIALTRAQTDPATGNQVNAITGWLDASNVYGSDAKTANSLRTSDGHMITFGGSLPVGPSGLVSAGDVRAAENPDLTALHTLMVREHNRWADQLIGQHPDWTGDQVYNESRALVTAEIQHVTYDEFLPLLLGPATPSAYHGFNPNVDPRISQDFAGAAYRFGHSIVSDAITAFDNQGNVTSDQSLAESFFEPASRFAETGADGLLRHLMSDPSNKMDAHIVDGLRNLLTDPPDGQDLAAINVQRGRDLGLQTLNGEREALGLTPHQSFADITSDPATASALSQIYSGDVNAVELWIGGLSEDATPGALVGPTFQAVIAHQFNSLRDGDPLWWQNQNFSDSEKSAIQNTTLADIIQRNTDTQTTQDNAFVFTERHGSDVVSGDPDVPQLVIGANDGSAVNGGPGDDTLVAGSGLSQVMSGFDGADTFQFLDGAPHTATVADFTVGTDRLDFEATVARGLTFNDLSITQDVSGSALVTLGDTQVTLSGVSANALSSRDVVFDQHSSGNII